MLSGDARATTVHKLLECGAGFDDSESAVLGEDDSWGWSFKRNEASPVQADGASSTVIRIAVNYLLNLCLQC